MRLIIALLFGLLFPNLVLSQGTKMEFSFNKDLVLGEQDNSDYFLAAPSMVLSNSKGEIFVADDRQGTILVFNKSGTFIRSFGGKGRGPGEFVNITSMTLLPLDQLLVYDYHQFRFTRYSFDGEVLQTKTIKKDIKPVSMRYVPGKGVALFYRILEGRNGAINPNHDYLIHFLDEELNETDEHYVSIENTIDTDQNFERYFEGGIHRGIFTSNDSTLTVAPFFYRGKILHYQIAKSLKLKNYFWGYIESSDPYKLYDDYKDVIGKGLITNSKVFGKLHGIMKNESLGVFQKQNGDYLHLGLLEIGDGQKLYVNLFNEQGELKAHGPVTNLNPGIQKNGYYRRMRFYWMDEQDQLYVIDGAEDGFYVYLGSIEVKE